MINNNKKHNKYLVNSIIVIIIMFTLLINLYLLIKNGFNKIVFIPTFYLFFIMIFPMNKRHLFNISVLIVNCCMFLRYSLLSLVYFINIGSLDRVSNLSIYLMIFEMFTIFITIEFFFRSPLFYKIQKKQNNNIKDISKDLSLNVNHGVSIILIISFGFILISYNPFFRNQLFRGFFSSQYSSSSNRNGLLWIVYYLFLVISVLLLLQKVKLFNCNNESIIKIIVSIIIILLYMVIISIGGTGSISRWPILFNGIIFIILLSNWYKKYRKLIITFFTICLVVGIFFLTIKKFLGTSVINKNTIKWGAVKIFNYDMFNDYFGGLKSIDYAILTKRLFGGKIDLKTLINDIFGNMPYINRILNIGNNRTSEFYNHAIYSSTIAVDKIVPMIGQGYIYLGIIFAPLFSIVSTIFALKMSLNCRESKNLLGFYIYLYLSITLSFFMFLNINIIFQTLWIKILPLIIVEKLNIKFGDKRL